MCFFETSLPSNAYPDTISLTYTSISRYLSWGEGPEHVTGHYVPNLWKRGTVLSGFFKVQCPKIRDPYLRRLYGLTNYIYHIILLMVSLPIPFK